MATVPLIRVRASSRAPFAVLLTLVLLVRYRQAMVLGTLLGLIRVVTPVSRALFRAGAFATSTFLAGVLPVPIIASANGSAKLGPLLILGVLIIMPMSQEDPVLKPNAMLVSRHNVPPTTAKDVVLLFARATPPALLLILATATLVSPTVVSALTPLASAAMAPARAVVAGVLLMLLTATAVARVISLSPLLMTPQAQATALPVFVVREAHVPGPMARSPLPIAIFVVPLFAIVRPSIPKALLLVLAVLVRRLMAKEVLLLAVSILTLEALALLIHLRVPFTNYLLLADVAYKLE